MPIGSKIEWYPGAGCSQPVPPRIRHGALLGCAYFILPVQAGVEMLSHNGIQVCVPMGGINTAPAENTSRIRTQHHPICKGMQTGIAITPQQRAEKHSLSMKYDWGISVRFRYHVPTIDGTLYDYFAFCILRFAFRQFSIYRAMGASRKITLMIQSIMKSLGHVRLPCHAHHKRLDFQARVHYSRARHVLRT